MRSVIYGALITVFLASAGTVQAGELDGKALLCTDGNLATKYPIYGLVFEQGKVSRHDVNGYSKFIKYNSKYRPWGTDLIMSNAWRYPLNRKTLIFGSSKCSLSSKIEIFKKMDEIIAAAKKKNKI